MPSAIEKAVDIANEAKEKVDSIAKTALISAAIGFLAVIGTFGAILYNSLSLQGDYFSEAISQVNSLESKFDQRIATTDQNIKSIGEKNDRIDTLSKETTEKARRID